LKTSPEWFVATAYVLGFLVVVGFAGLLLLPTIWHAIKLVNSGNPTGEDLRAILFSVGAMVALPFVVWRIWTSHVSAIASRKQAEIAHIESLTSLFSKAVEQLGQVRSIEHGDKPTTEPNIEVRLGAIYSLQRLAQDSQRDFDPILQTLCAYIRQNTRPLTKYPVQIEETIREMEKGEDADNIQNVRNFLDNLLRPREDVIAALLATHYLALNYSRSKNGQLGGTHSEALLDLRARAKSS